jgi:hypothetical protein
VSVAEHLNLQADSSGSGGRNSVLYRIGQATVIFLLGLALALAAMALFIHGVANYNHLTNGGVVYSHPPVSTNRTPSVHVGKP